MRPARRATPHRTAEEPYGVIGESEGDPVLYHLVEGKVVAESLRKRRAAMIGRPCFVVPMASWLADPRRALRQAQAESFGDTLPE